MTRYGLLLDIEYCTGCHSCEAACKQEKGFPVGQWGIKIAENGPWEISKDNWQYDYLALPTKQCDLCSARVEMGKKPACVHHCQAQCLTYGTLEELVADMAQSGRKALFTPTMS